ncbi:LOW QUALITY PROTEIN: MLIP isoform 1, partial [Pongo abelii]
MSTPSPTMAACLRLDACQQESTEPGSPDFADESTSKCASFWKVNHVITSKSNDYLTLNAGSQQETDQATLTCPSEVSGTILQEREFEANKLQGMQQSDLFKAEYVLIV